MRKDDDRRDPATWLLVAGFLAGVAHLFLTPPFEGFDETAHYSSVQQIADTGRIPVYGRDRFSADVVDYLAAAPRPYASIPPFDENGGLTYASVFAAPETVAAARAMINARPRERRNYAPAGSMNWQAQHPPLAYLFLAPVYQATKGLDWKSHLFFLRLTCWIAAMTGLAVGVVATRAHYRRKGGCAAYDLYVPAFMAAWPFCAPMFFPEMARLGNDAFCLLFAGLAWAALLGYLSAGAAKLKWAALLGLALGMGALTKAFFLPAAAGVGLFLLVRDAMAARAAGACGPARLARALAPALAVGLVFLAIAAWWYAAKYAETGVLTGASDIIALKGEDGFAGLFSEQIAPALVLKRFASLYLSFLWAGTWSLANIPYAAVAVFGVFLAVVIGAYLHELFTRRRRDEALWALIAIIAPVGLGLVYHLLIHVAMGEKGVSIGGWYLHIFAGPLGLAYGAGAIALMRRRWGRAVFAVGIVYTLALAATAEAFQLGLFSGCVVKPPDSNIYRVGACFGDLGEMWPRLALTVNPAMGSLAFVLAAGAFCWAVYAGARRRGTLDEGR